MFSGSYCALIRRKAFQGYGRECFGDFFARIFRNKVQVASLAERMNHAPRFERFLDFLLGRARRDKGRVHQQYFTVAVYP